MSLNHRTFWIKVEKFKTVKLLKKVPTFKSDAEWKNICSAQETVKQRDQCLEQIRKRISQQRAQETNKQRGHHLLNVVHLCNLAVHRRSQETGQHQPHLQEQHPRNP